MNNNPTDFVKVRIFENDYEYVKYLSKPDYRLLQDMLNKHATPEGHLGYRYKGVLIIPEITRFDNVYGLMTDLDLNK